jgi:tRNA splicing endonuclease
MIQTGTTSTNGLLYCQKARDLLDAFSTTIREVITLHEDQFQAVLASDDDSERFDDLIHMANERKRDAKYAYLRHLEIHDCSKIVPDDLKRSG